MSPTYLCKLQTFNYVQKEKKIEQQVGIKFRNIYFYVLLKKFVLIVTGGFKFEIITFKYKYLIHILIGMNYCSYINCIFVY